MEEPIPENITVDDIPQDDAPESDTSSDTPSLNGVIQDENDKFIRWIIDESDSYKIFDFEKECKDRKILKRAYKALVVKVHPDKNDHPDATKAFLKIQNDYKYILDHLVVTNDELKIPKRRKPSPKQNKKSNAEEKKEPKPTPNFGMYDGDQYFGYAKSGYTKYANATSYQ